MTSSQFTKLRPIHYCVICLIKTHHTTPVNNGNYEKCQYQEYMEMSLSNTHALSFYANCLQICYNLVPKEPCCTHAAVQHQ